MDRFENTSFLYREVPVDYDGVARINSIKGNTVKFNQMLSQLINRNIKGLTATYDTDGSYVINGTATDNGEFRMTDFIPVQLNHRYFIKGCIKNGSDNTYYVQIWANQGASSVRAEYGDGIIIDIATTYANMDIALYFTFKNGVSINNEKVYPQIFDMTAMGMGEYTTEQFRRWLSTFYPLPYYAYNPGMLIPFKGMGLKTVGFNQWDEQWELGSYNVSNGEKVTRNDAIRCKNFISVLPSKNYYFGCASHPSASNGILLWYDAEMNYIKYTTSVLNTIVQTPSNANYCTFYIAPETTYNNDICINISDTSKNGTYEPYTESTLSLEALNTLFPTGMKEAGSVYDEISDKAYTRVGSVDLGSLTWAYNANYGMYTTGLDSLIKRPAAFGTIANIICSNRTVAAWDIVYTSGTESGLCGVTTTGIFGMSTTETNPETFKSAMSGQYLFYELATPTSQDISLDLTYPIWNDGTEQILPENGSVPTTAPILADIDYATGFVNVFTHPNPLLGGETSGDGRYMVGEQATINAVPNEHYIFQNWMLDDEIVSTEEEYTFEVSDE